MKNVKRQKIENNITNVAYRPSIGREKSSAPVSAEQLRNVQAFSRRRKGSSAYFRRESKVRVLDVRRQWRRDYGESSCGHLPPWEATVNNTTSLIAHGQRRALAETQRTAVRSRFAPINVCYHGYSLASVEKYSEKTKSRCAESGLKCYNFPLFCLQSNKGKPLP